MIGLAEIEQRLRGLRDFAVLDESHLHRATREDDWGLIKTRDRLRADSIVRIAEEGAGSPSILHDLGDMIVFETAAGWRGHRWVVREGDRVAAETLVVDGTARARALRRDPPSEAASLAALHPVHAPLGELRSGNGQLGPGDLPHLPPGFPDAALAEAARLHRLWNARSLDQAIDDWCGPADVASNEANFVLNLLALLPDATLTIERGVAATHAVALLWRLHGHDATGARIRAIGSSIRTGDGRAETMLDMLSIAAQPLRPIIDYSG